MIWWQFVYPPRKKHAFASGEFLGKCFCSASTRSPLPLLGLPIFFWAVTKTLVKILLCIYVSGDGTTTHLYKKGVAMISYSEFSDPGIPNVYVSHSESRVGFCNKPTLRNQKIWVFPKIGVPQNGWFVMENPIEMDDLRVPLFSETSVWRFQETSGNSAWEDVWVWAPQQLFTWKEVISNRLCWNGPMLKNTTLSDFFEICTTPIFLLKTCFTETAFTQSDSRFL